MGSMRAFLHINVGNVACFSGEMVGGYSNHLLFPEKGGKTRRF